MSDIWKRIGSQIKEKREQRGMTQGQLGAKVGAKKSYISAVESGGRPCSINKLQEIANALDCKLDVVVRER